MLAMYVFAFPDVATLYLFRSSFQFFVGTVLCLCVGFGLGTKATCLGFEKIMFEIKIPPRISGFCCLENGWKSRSCKNYPAIVCWQMFKPNLEPWSLVWHQRPLFPVSCRNWLLNISWPGCSDIIATDMSSVISRIINFQFGSHSEEASITE